MAGTTKATVETNGSRQAPAAAEALAPSVRDGYRVELSLGDSPRLTPVAKTCLRWLTARHFKVQGPYADLSFLRQGSGNVWTLDLFLDQHDYRERVGIELDTHCRPPSLKATIKRTLLPSWEAGWEPSEDSPPSPCPPPTLVPVLIRDHGAFRDKPILLTPRVCAPEHVVELVQYLRDSERTMPVLVVSRAARARPLPKVQHLAMTVAGLAHVYVFADDFSAAAFCEEVGPGLACGGGEARLYRPGLQDGDAPERHRSWSQRYILSERRWFELEVMDELVCGECSQAQDGPCRRPSPIANDEERHPHRRPC